MKSIKIDIYNNTRSLLETLREMGYFLPAWCGGRGTCGKCKVQFLSECPPVIEKDQLIFTEEELTEGWRLACMVQGKGSYDLLIPDYKEEEIDTADSFSMENNAGKTSVRDDSGGYVTSMNEEDSCLKKKMEGGQSYWQWIRLSLKDLSMLLTYQKRSACQIIANLIIFM